MNVTRDAEDVLVRLRPRLVRWYRAQQRDLPWRRTRDPYRIWISEIMLQQTRVDVVVPYYRAFVRRYPTVRALARAPLEDVLRAWSGLGYYRRARHLHAAAQTVVREHGGRVPDDVPGLRALPGIGDYTAGAIASIAFGRREPILDGNVVRVFARWFEIEDDVESPAVRRRMWELARRWACTRTPGDANQALMELGATVCTRAAPRCDACPVRRMCRARAAGRTLELPRPRKRPEPSRVHAIAFLVRRGGALLLVRRTSGRLLQDWWEVPIQVDTRAAATSRPTAARVRRWAARLQQRVGVKVTAPHVLETVRHGILAHRIELRVVTAAAARGGSVRAAARAASRGANGGPKATPLANLDLAALEVRWVRPAASRALPLSTLTRKALQRASRHDSTWSEYLDERIGQQRAHERRADPTEKNVGEGSAVDRAHALGQTDAENRSGQGL